MGHACMTELVAIWVAKKAIVFTAANIYGITKLYRKTLKLNRNYLGNTTVGYKLARHTFDFTAGLSRKLTIQCARKLPVQARVDMKEQMTKVMRRRQVRACGCGRCSIRWFRTCEIRILSDYTPSTMSKCEPPRNVSTFPFIARASRGGGVGCYSASSSHPEISSVQSAMR